MYISGYRTPHKSSAHFSHISSVLASKAFPTEGRTTVHHHHSADIKIRRWLGPQAQNCATIVHLTYTSHTWGPANTQTWAFKQSTVLPPKGGPAGHPYSQMIISVSPITSHHVHDVTPEPFPRTHNSHIPKHISFFFVSLYVSLPPVIWHGIIIVISLICWWFNSMSPSLDHWSSLCS